MGAKLSLLSSDLDVYLKQTEESTVNFFKNKRIQQCLIYKIFSYNNSFVNFSTFCILFPIFKFGNMFSWKVIHFFQVS